MRWSVSQFDLSLKVRISQKQFFLKKANENVFLISTLASKLGQIKNKHTVLYSLGGI